MREGMNGSRQKTTTLIVALLCLALQACAYNYAAREGRRAASTEPESTAAPETGASTDTAHQTEASSKQPAHEAVEDEGDICGRLVFEVHYFDAEARYVRQLACESGEVLNVQRVPMTNSFLERARQARHPEQVWYVLVDPEGLRTRYLTNPQLREVQARYQSELVGRDPIDDVLIYQLHIEGF
ncbi:hypothetical protein EA187_01990 [Lujinxingia sediminis]|uniref:Uncharacterized protein n=1 Tax=Lujinxingia sediminis TaxID=2480984 RepID=A0ABY0CXR9_9DELT|nr:hypothetical protein [Lujinxingia sediminis]RVU48230.1 hypothetical protein EA187_01990 [Lujinxingia sediminis]